MLVQQLLLGRTDGLTASQLAAFLSGWTSLLDLLKRPELCLPEAAPEVHEALRSLAHEIERAQTELLSDDDEPAGA